MKTDEIKVSGHNLKHGMSCTIFWKKYRSLKERCCNKNHQRYKYYWEKGIVCEWENFEDFMDDMYESYLCHVEKFWKKQTTIERIDVNWNYCKENCRWATIKEQANNKTNNTFYEYNWERMTLQQWAVKTWIKRETISRRVVHHKRSIKKALTTPPGSTKIGVSCSGRDIVHDYKGEKLTFTQLAKRTWINRWTITSRFYRGWLPIEECLYTPKKPGEKSLSKI